MANHLFVLTMTRDRRLVSRFSPPCLRQQWCSLPHHTTNRVRESWTAAVKLRPQAITNAVFPFVLLASRSPPFPPKLEHYLDKQSIENNAGAGAPLNLKDDEAFPSL